MKAGLIEVVESQSSRIPIYAENHHREESFMVIQYAAGERKRERFYSIEEARKRAKATSYWEAHSNSGARWTSVSVTGFFK